MWKRFEVRFKQSFCYAVIVAGLVSTRILGAHVLPCHPGFECGDVSILTQASFALINHSGPVWAHRHIIFSGPYDHYRRFDLFGDHRRLVRIVGECFSAETTTKKGHVDDDFFHGQLKMLGEAPLYPIWSLDRPPDLASICRNVGNAIERLHAAMRFVRCLVQRLQFLVCLVVCRVEVSF